MNHRLICVFILNLIILIHGMVIPCVDYNQCCYGRTCCDPYVCYEETVCIRVNTTHP